MTFAFEKISDSIPRRASSCAWASSFLAEWSLDNLDRKSTRLNSSHSQISYAVFCLKKKNAHLSDTIAARTVILSHCPDKPYVRSYIGSEHDGRAVIFCQQQLTVLSLPRKHFPSFK